MLPDTTLVPEFFEETQSVMHLPSSKPFATPEKLHTAVQKKSQTLKISGGQARTASTVALTRLGLPMVDQAIVEDFIQTERLLCLEQAT